jgi:hypothetical protein
MPDTAPSARPPLRDGLGLAAAALAIYALFGQSRFYLFDAETFYMLVARGQLEHPNHPLYLPACAGLAALLEPLGISLFRAMTLASALGTAVWVFTVHRAAATLGLARGPAQGAALLCATAPSVVFFATVIEVHGVFLAFAGLAFVAAARVARDPRPGRILVLGLATGLAATAHASGHLLPIAVGLWLCAEVPALRVPPTLAKAALLGASAHVLGRIGSGALVGGGDLAATLDYVGAQAGRFRLSQLPRTLWYEWLLPFAPVSLVALAALAGGPQRRVARALHAALVPYLAVAALMLGLAIVEHGAYLQPLLFVAAVLTVRVLPGPAVAAAAVLGLGLGLAQVRAHDRPEADALRPAEVLALRGTGEAVFVMADEAEARPVLLAAPDLAVVRLELLTQGLLERDDAAAFAEFDGAFRSITGGGRGVVYLSQRAYRELLRRGDRLLGHLERSYELLPRVSGDFRCYELRPR